MSDKKNEESSGAPAWMVTYGDLVTLLMCFFVLLFAFSEIDAQKFEAVMQSFQGSAGVLSGGTTLSDSPLVFTGMPEVNTSLETVESQVLDDLKKEIESQLDDANIDLEITAEIINRGLLIRFPDNALFDSGRADLKAPAMEALTVIGNILLEEPFTERVISVEGHTDNVPMRSSEFPSNWELSTTRATNVIRYFLDEVGIKPKRLSASGYGEYYPIATNETAEGRSQNRRVDIVVMREFFTTKQPEINEGE